MAERPATQPACPWSAAFAGCALGAALLVGQARLWPLPVYQGMVALAGCLALLAVCLALRYKKSATPARWRPWAAFAISAALVFASSGWRAHAFAARALDGALEGRNLRITGTVASMVQTLAQGGQRWRFAVQEARLGSASGPVVALPPLVELSWYPPLRGQRSAAPIPPMRPGEVWALTVRLKRPHGARNPHGFDYELWQWQRGVQATGYVRAAPPAHRLHAGRGHWLEGLRQRLRDNIMAGQDGQRQRLAGVVAALAVGDQPSIARADWALFRDTGVAHLMSISGLHITMFAWLFARLAGWLWRRSSRACAWCPAPQVALPGGVLLAAAYALLSGWGIPAQRTVCMLCLVALLRGLGVRWPWPVVWGAALALVLSLDPWAWWQAGFWLSFVAVGVLLAGSLREAEEGTGLATQPWWRRWWQQWWQLGREQWRISLALAPLGLMLFGQVSPSGLLANLVAIPWVTLVITPLSLAAAVHAPLVEAAIMALLPLMELLQWLHRDWALLRLPQPPLWAGAAAMAGMLVLLGPLPRAWRIWGGLLCLPALHWPAWPVPEGEFALLAPDIGQGNAVLVRTARHSLLYDSGPRYASHAAGDEGAGHDANNDAGGRVLLPLFRSLGVRPDALWISHSDNDHSGGALTLLRAWPGMALWGSDSVLRDPRLGTLGRVQRCQAGQGWEWDGVRFSVLHPATAHLAPKAQALRRANQNSCVLLVQSASGRSALLAGDIFAAQERALVQAGALPALDWLLVPHHGSRTSSSRAFLQATRPRWALVQAGYRNRYGHPAPDVLARHAAIQSRVVQQAHCGASRWASQRPEELMCERQRHLRHWDVHMRPP